MWASSEGHTETMSILLDKGANVNDKKNDGVSSIISASYGGFIDAVKLLLDKGADVNAKCQNHETALMSASDKGHLDVVSMLIEKGADINAKSIDGDTALAKAANKRNCRFFKYNFAGLSYDVSKLDINYKKIIETLLDAGADVNGLDKNNRYLEEIIEKRNNIKGNDPF